MSVTAMHNFRGVPGVTPEDDEAAFGEMDVQGTGFVDMYELADALRVMGKSEREASQRVGHAIKFLCRSCEGHMMSRMLKAQASWISKNWRMPARDGYH